MLVHLGKRLYARANGVRLDDIHRGGAVGRVPMKLAPNKFVKLLRALARHGAAVRHQQAAAVFHIRHKRVLHGGGFPRGIVRQRLVVAFTHDHNGIIAQPRRVKLARIVNNVDVEALRL